METTNPKKSVPSKRPQVRSSEPQGPKIQIIGSTPELTQRLNPRSALTSDGSSSTSNSIPTDTPLSPHSTFVRAKLTKARWLTTHDALKQVLHLQLKPGKEQVSTAEQEWLSTWRPGDAVGISCPNRDDHVDYLLERLSLSDVAEEEVVIEQNNNSGPQKWRADLKERGTVTIRDLLREFVEVSSIPKFSFLKMLALYCSAESDRDSLLFLASPEGRDRFREEIQEGGGGSVMDLLEKYKSSEPPLSHVVSELPSLQPRFYSLCSSRKLLTTTGVQDTTVLEVAFSLLQFTTKNGHIRHGLCSHYLAAMAEKNLSLPQRSTLPWSAFRGVAKNEKSSVWISYRKAALFRPPEDVRVPLIMIGPGTGVAPFLGFLQEREALSHSRSSCQDPPGKSLLFFGCRHRDRDFLFKEELKELQAKGVLHDLITSFSREGEEVEYVQHSLLARGEEVVRAMNNQESAAVLYLCGDARGMAKDVRSCLLQIISAHGAAPELPDECLNRWIKERRFLMDVWG